MSPYAAAGISLRRPRHAELAEVVSAPMANLLLSVKEAFAESKLA
jgi:hypothetical protein